MGSVTLNPGAISIHSGGNTLTPAYKFGTQPEWADGSDSSGAYVSAARISGSIKIDRAYATLAPLVLPAGATVTGIQAEMRCSATSSPALPASRPNPRAGVSLYSGTYTPGGFNTYVNEFETATSASQIGSWYIIADGATHDLTCPLGTLDGSLAQATTALAAGCTIEVRRLSENETYDYNHHLTVYELRVVVSYAGGDVPAVSYRRRCRRFPRGD